MRVSVVIMFVCGWFVSPAQEAHTIAKNEWLNCVKELCEKSCDSEAFFIYSKLSRMISIIPKSTGYSIEENFDSGVNNIFSIIILKTDQILVVSGMSIVNFIQYTTNPAQFFFDTVYLKDYYNISNFGKGISLLHEGYHAVNAYKQRYSFPKSYALQEIAAYTFQNRIQEKIGGDKYQKLLDQELSIFDSLLNKKGADKMTDSIDMSVVPRTSIHSALDSIFGKFESFQDICDKESSFYVNAVFRFIDKHATEEYMRIDLKSYFILNLYMIHK